MTLSGNHLIAGDWVGGSETFRSDPSSGEAHEFSRGAPEHVEQAATAAERAFESYGNSSVETRAALLNRIADEIDARGDEITRIGHQETGLPEARMIGERGRTVGQLRLFAEHILAGTHLDLRHDQALPERAPLPRPDLWLVQQPVGPVAVFGASNFPLAFSVAGGDTAAALAAGCPVIVKGHSAHPGTSEIVAQAIDVAIQALDVDPGVFSLIQGGDRRVGEALVTHPLVKAVGFTGSLRGGRALYDLCAARAEPIPFFGELGSINPMFLFPHALANRADQIAAGWAGSLTMGAGQFCTNPGVAILVGEQHAERFVEKTATALAAIDSQTMLTDGIALAFRDGRDAVRAITGVEELVAGECSLRGATPHLYRVDGDAWLAAGALAHEVFGPLGVIVSARDLAQAEQIARGIEGQLTCTLHIDAADEALAKQLMPILERKAGRILANGFPTGVEVCDSMVHGGPYPASTNFGATSVGTLSIRRFLRPVCYQNLPAGLRPSSTRDA